MKKNILVTGASGNLGQAVVEKLISQGDQVIATFSPGRVKAQAGVATYEADLTSEKSVDETINKIINDHQRVDAAVLTVGGFATGTLAETNMEAIKKMMSINFETAFNVAQPVFQHMATQGGGRIVLIGSRPGIHASEGKNAVAYALSKTLVFKLAELLNADGKNKNIVCSVIVPGTIDTPTNRASLATANYNDWVKPEAIAEAIAYLISENGSSLREPVLKMYANS